MAYRLTPFVYSSLAFCLLYRMFSGASKQAYSFPSEYDDCIASFSLSLCLDLLLVYVIDNFNKRRYMLYALFAQHTVDLSIVQNCHCVLRPLFLPYKYAQCLSLVKFHLFLISVQVCACGLSLSMFLCPMTVELQKKCQNENLKNINPRFHNRRSSAPFARDLWPSWPIKTFYRKSRSRSDAASTWGPPLQAPAGPISGQRDTYCTSSTFDRATISNKDCDQTCVTLDQQRGDSQHKPMTVCVCVCGCMSTELSSWSFLL